MAQMWLLWCPKTTKSGGDTVVASASTATPKVTNINGGRSPSSLGKNGCCCGCLASFVRKVKKQSKEMVRVRGAGASRQTSFQCRYDPLSYSLNFDKSGCGSLEDDEDYLHAFSSRFVANPRRPSSTQPASHSNHSTS
ncbi:hypothetical protein CCACVL1_16385 [Corchorus capsularis]|uniref:Uncharacterized protein n=1 Tax=Corchorus capsularis TaxID=210143 RepID=A0A1R3HXA1_COCAP|nr:hypothetical protein CCACVL1_16385 [Corchorus capsularis]